MSTSRFAHLHLPTATIASWTGPAGSSGCLERAKALQMSALATGRSRQPAWGRWNSTSRPRTWGIKPIVGYEAYVAPQSRFHKEASGVEGGGLPPDPPGDEPDRLQRTC